MNMTTLLLGVMCFYTLVVPATQSNVHVFTFHKNEHDLLADWLTYHFRIFGPSNVHIIDNNSTIPSVVDILNIARAAGVDVHSYTGPFNQKKNVLTRIMHDVILSDSTIDWVVPLDVDEFVVGRLSAGVYTTDRNAILQTIDHLPRDGHKFKFGQITAILCDSALASQRRRLLDAVFFGYPTAINCKSKTFYPAPGFLSTDQGNHRGKVIADFFCSKNQTTRSCAGCGCFHETNLSIVHYGAKAMSWPAYKAKMIRGAHAYAHHIESKCSGNGSHYCRFIQDLNRHGEEHVRRNYTNTCDPENCIHSHFMVHQVFNIGNASYINFPRRFLRWPRTK